jgi:CRISPR/Cas system-associated protein Cas10 (large subunit of type III CRISPR-Cas system)
MFLGGIATEVGSRAFRFHIQGVFEIRYPTSLVYQKELGNYIYYYLYTKLKILFLQLNSSNNYFLEEEKATKFA